MRNKVRNKRRDNASTKRHRLFEAEAIEATPLQRGNRLFGPDSKRLGVQAEKVWNFGFLGLGLSALGLNLKVLDLVLEFWAWFDNLGFPVHSKEAAGFFCIQTPYFLITVLSLRADQTEGIHNTFFLDVFFYVFYIKHYFHNY